MLRRRLPSLNSLLAFEAAARLGGFTNAAREMGIAQPAITRHITNLEDWLGVKLFKRNKNSVELSPDGYAVAELVTPTFDRLELGLGQFRSMRNDDVTVGASFGITHMWLMPRITAMRGVMKDATINFVTSENYSDFESMNVDLSIRFGAGDWPGKTASLIFEEITCVIASPDFLKRNPGIDPLNLPGTLKPEWLLDHGDPFNYGWMTWPRWYEHHDQEIPKELKKKDIANYPTVLDMVRCGEGVALGYVGLDDDMVEAGQIVRIGPKIHRPNLGYYVITPSGRKENSACQDLAKFLTTHIR